MPKKAAQKKTPAKASPKKTETVVEKVTEAPAEKVQEEIAPKVEPVVVAPTSPPAVVEPPKQKIVVEEKDAPVVQAKNNNSGQVESAKVKPIPAVEPNATLEIEKITKSQEVPTVDKNSPLKVEEIETKKDEPPIEKSGKKLFVLGGIVLALIILGVLGFVFLFAQNQPAEKKAAVTQETVKTTPTPEAINRSEWSFEVLNGSGVAGAAKNAADKLKTLGYHVINTDNADTSNYTENKLYVAADMTDKEDLLIADLKADFTIASVSGVLKNSTASARIIIGK